MKLLDEINWRNAYSVLSFSLVLFLIECTIYHFAIQLNVQQYWIAIPVLLYLILIFSCKFIKTIYIVAVSLEMTSLISLLILFCSIKIYIISMWMDNRFEAVAFIIILSFFISIIISRLPKKEKSNKQQNDFSKKLFNLFYLNTSKAHEIAMLIDNKIMKTIEREQVSEELLKYNTSLTLGKKDAISTEMGYSIEDSSKKRVYENFDVKTTKSIMLRKIYETTQKKKHSHEDLQIGDLTIFENIELQQMNIDDTIMILNVLQDSKINNQTNDSFEINFNKMMDKMMDDFTINYTFAYGQEGKESKHYIIQIPYKSTGNFENGYQHNDLQLGKLSLIGIYRGEIDFSKRESISSKFLELMSESYNQEIHKIEDAGGMKLSYNGSISSNIQFEFHHEKLKGKLHLIDVIAIIQELNFDKDE